MQRRQRQLLVSDLAFERARLLNLIDSNVRRKDLDHARALAEELFRTELAFTLRWKTERFRMLNNLILNFIMFLVTVFLGSIICMVLNINPHFYLLVNIVAFVSVLFAITFGLLFANRFERTVKVIVEASESMRQSFIDKVIENFSGCGASHGGLEPVDAGTAK